VNALKFDGVIISHAAPLVTRFISLLFSAQRCQQTPRSVQK